MNDFILKAGDIAVDENGFVHGPLRRREDNLGLYACGQSWDFHGNPISGMPAPLVAHYPRIETPPAVRRGEVIVIRRSRPVAAENDTELRALLTWLKGFVAGDRGHNTPPGIGALTDLTFCLSNELQRTAHDGE